MIKNSNNIEFWKGQLFELQTADREIFFTQLIKNGDASLLIQRPVNRKNMFMPITSNLPITVYYYDDEQQGLYTFESNIELYQNRQVVMGKPSVDSIKKAERRRYFRVQVGVEMRLCLQSPDNSSEIEYTTLLTHDISGGGLSFLYPDKLVEKGDLVVGTLHLKTKNDQKKIGFNGKVVNMIKLQNKFFRISLEFIQMKEPVRADMIKFCMTKQIELRKKLKHYSI
ncbi:hypothetical protein DCC39_12510 [Pueribacillus theae]|uniref:PilZ domain-containing protein n=1 Tax=Pueribacillus theae TaxID=2171751 RepID=A0A2U1JY98_9BACI|nr:PilZ domain-containing protein [Pueribacillus theae]PWA09778.1 hypothetical protein DCC39_12510 [Pueribacillus theae]